MSEVPGTATRSRDQPVLVLVAVTAVLLALPVVLLAGEVHLVAVPGVFLAAALIAAGRDSLHAGVALAIVVLLWLMARPNAVSPWSLVLALLMLTAHAAVALRSSVPPGAPLDRGVVLRWVGRGLAVTGITGLVYLVGLAVHQLNRGDNQLIVVAAPALLGGLILLLRHETVEDRPA